MDYQVILSDFFISDLEEIVIYITREAGTDLAARVGNELINRATELARTPLIGQPVKQRSGARKILRYPYQIYYDVNEENRTIEVLRVWHGARP
jgi:plasmid stabilization system protein ParE